MSRSPTPVMRLTMAALAAGCLGMAACAVRGPAYSQAPIPAAGAELIVYRYNSQPRSEQFRAREVSVGGQSLGAMESQSYTRVPLPPGAHLLGVRVQWVQTHDMLGGHYAALGEYTARQAVRLRAGERQYYRFTGQPRPEGMASRVGAATIRGGYLGFTLQSIPEAQALAELQHCRQNR